MIVIFLSALVKLSLAPAGTQLIGFNVSSANIERGSLKACVLAVASGSSWQHYLPQKPPSSRVGPSMAAKPSAVVHLVGRSFGRRQRSLQKVANHSMMSIMAGDCGSRGRKAGQVGKGRGHPSNQKHERPCEHAVWPTMETEGVLP